MIEAKQKNLQNPFLYENPEKNIKRILEITPGYHFSNKGHQKIATKLIT